jgi:HTH-type transcriptional regulator/antitoxin HigA
MQVQTPEINEIAKIWPIASRFVSVIHTEEQYIQARGLLDKLIDKIGEDENHELASLMETIAAHIEDYEAQTVPEPQGDAIGCLKYLMQEHRLKQGDLTELGSQGVVSEILSGKRKLNVRQIKALSQRFNVSPNVFID